MIWLHQGKAQGLHCSYSGRIQLTLQHLLHQRPRRRCRRPRRRCRRLRRRCRRLRRRCLRPRLLHPLLRKVLLTTRRKCKAVGNLHLLGSRRHKRSISLQIGKCHDRIHLDRSTLSSIPIRTMRSCTVSHLCHKAFHPDHCPCIRVDLPILRLLDSRFLVVPSDCHHRRLG